ncbi:hypothetical protein VTK56DRAFT_220 [Thermocarpiscus australiensis]
MYLENNRCRCCIRLPPCELAHIAACLIFPCPAIWRPQRMGDAPNHTTFASDLLAQTACYYLHCEASSTGRRRVDFISMGGYLMRVGSPHVFCWCFHCVFMYSPFPSFLAHRFCLARVILRVCLVRGHGWDVLCNTAFWGKGVRMAFGRACDNVRVHRKMRLVICE